jgi:adenylate cyclase
MGDDEATTVAALNACRDIFREHIGLTSGRVVDTAGDSVLAVFDSVVEATQCAVDVQAALAEQNAALAEGRRMLFRIGVNLGDIIEQQDGTIYGDGVNVAARLESLAEPGGICFSDKVHGEIERKLDLAAEFIGEHEVKNISRPVRAYRVAERQPTRQEATALAGKASAPAIPEGPALAVLPFANLSHDPEQAYFADGIVEEIITELSRFGDLRVLGRISTLQYKDRAVDVREIGRDLDVGYVLEGSVRRGGDRLRITAQLLEAEGGSHLWAETYERDLTASDIFDIQDDITAEVVAKVGGAYGAVARERMNRLRRGRTESLAAYDCMRLYHQWLATFDEGDYRAAREALQRAVKVDPSYADAWAGLSSIYACEVTLFHDLNPDALDRALTTAQRAVHLAPDHAIAHRTLAHARLLRREDGAFYEAAERALAVNPNDTHNMGIIAGYLCMAGNWDMGLALRKTVAERDPLCLISVRLMQYLDHYRKREFEQALALAHDGLGVTRKADHLFAAAACGALGDLTGGRAALDAVRRLQPDIDDYLALSRHRTFDQVRDGLRKVGMAIPDVAGEA